MAQAAIETGGRLRFGAREAALAILVLAGATIAGAWIFEYFGYAPCDLCLKQRYAYYAGVPLALAAVFATRWRRGLAPALFAALGLIFLASAIFGTYHAGVEWGFWPGPADCTGAIGRKASSMVDFRKQLESVRIVRCDAVAIRILGLSLAGWNAVISVALVALAGLGLRAGGGSRIARRAE